ncbi:MAG: hypothetical protein U0414_18040 [Polyangiaceae bacterium]
MNPDGPSTPLLVVFGITTLALAFGVPLLLLRERVDRPARFAAVSLVLYLGIGIGVRTLLVRELPEPEAVTAAYARGELTLDEHDEKIAGALEARAQSARTGMGLGLMAAIGLAWAVRIVAGRRLERFATEAELPKHIVGCACALCDETIAMELEGKHCRGCGASIHKRCAAKHRALAHPHAAPRKAKKARTEIASRSLGVGAAHPSARRAAA